MANDEEVAEEKNVEEEGADTSDSDASNEDKEEEVVEEKAKPKPRRSARSRKELVAALNYYGGVCAQLIDDDGNPTVVPGPIHVTAGRLKKVKDSRTGKFVEKSVGVLEELEDSDDHILAIDLSGKRLYTVDGRWYQLEA